MIPQWIIEKKRDGLELAGAEIDFFVRGYMKGSIPDYQMAALAMAIAIRGMTLAETRVLTGCMLASGVVLDTSAIRRPKIDKHSTGGIGDKISLILAPLVASCGIAVPMIAGRGLGVTGGTLDKLEAIPGFRVDLSEKRFLRVVAECGCSITGASERMAPADKKLYALRDVTGSVPSIPLIVASILSKKLAAGLDGIVYDVKCGAGAFMKTKKEAGKLAETLVKVSALSKLRANAFITDMNEPLGRAVGNAHEVVEAVETLRGKGPGDVVELTLALGARMLLTAGLVKRAEVARSELARKINSGEAFERFKLMVRLQGGDPNCLERPDGLIHASIIFPVKAGKSGYVEQADAGLIGMAALALGAGRNRLEDKIDHSAGIMVLKKKGFPVERGEPLAWLYANSERRMEFARPLASRAFKIGPKRGASQELITGAI
jgi:pyrimidine-nucleoside phosphorylase